MGFTYIVALLVAAISLVYRRPPLADDDGRPGRPAAALAIVVVSVLAYAFELAAYEQRQGIRTFLPVYSEATFALVLGATFVVQSALLAGLARTLGRPGAPLRIAIALGSVAMLGLSLHQQNTGGDLTAYVGSAMQHDPYVPSRAPFPAAFASINRIWGTPMVPSTYGPLWNAIAAAAAAPFATLPGKLLAMQLLGAVALLGIVATLLRTKAPPAVVVLVALNPFLWEQYVAEAHNDLLAAAFVVVAARSATMRTIVLAVVASAAIKVSFALTGLATLARLSRRADRLTGAAWIVGLVGLTIALAGAEYPRAVVRVLALYAHPLPPGDVVLRELTELAVAVFAVVAVVAGRVPWGTPWIPIALGQFPLTNYLCWGLPTALVGNGAAIFLIALPYAAFEANNILAETPLSIGVRLAAGVALAAVLVLGLRRAGRPGARSRALPEPSRAVA